MQNPWLSIPASDYEAHMGSSGTRQLEFLSNVFKRVLATHRPNSLALLGCATGNGLEHLGPDSVNRIIGIEINPEYVKVARNRFGTRLPNLELICSDIRDIDIEPHSLDLISCGLFLEHVDPDVVLTRAQNWLKPGGVFATVLQLPAATNETVSNTGIASLKLLEPFAQLVDPEVLTTKAERAGLTMIESETVTLDTGKSFYIVAYRMTH